MESLNSTESPTASPTTLAQHAQRSSPFSRFLLSNAYVPILLLAVLMTMIAGIARTANHYRRLYDSWEAARKFEFGKQLEFSDCCIKPLIWTSLQVPLFSLTFLILAPTFTLLDWFLPDLCAYAAFLVLRPFRLLYKTDKSRTICRSIRNKVARGLELSWMLLVSVDLGRRVYFASVAELERNGKFPSYSQSKSLDSRSVSWKYWKAQVKRASFWGEYSEKVMYFSHRSIEDGEGELSDEKFRFLIQTAKQMGLSHVWIDFCCSSKVAWRYADALKILHAPETELVQYQGPGFFDTAYTFLEALCAREQVPDEYRFSSELFYDEKDALFLFHVISLMNQDNIFGWLKPKSSRVTNGATLVVHAADVFDEEEAAQATFVDDEGTSDEPVNGAVLTEGELRSAVRSGWCCLVCGSYNPISAEHCVTCTSQRTF